MQGPRPRTGLLVMPQAVAPACLDPEARMGRNHFKTLRKAHGRGWELVCAAAWDTGQHSQWEQGKQIPQDPGLVHGRDSRTFGSARAESPAWPWEGSAGSWVQSREDEAHHLGRFFS